MFDLIPTPPNDAGDPACSLVESNKDDKKKGTKSKAQSSDSSSLVIDKDWVAEHARQVTLFIEIVLCIKHVFVDSSNPQLWSGFLGIPYYVCVCACVVLSSFIYLF